MELLEMFVPLLELLLDKVVALELLDVGELPELLDDGSPPEESSEEQAMRVSMPKARIISILFIDSNIEN
jgi:hypothetical protein